MTQDEIIIRNAIIHILDSEAGEPELSGHLLEPGPDLNDLIRGLIFKIASSDDLKECQFADDSEFLSILMDFSEEAMASFSCEIADGLYGIMKANVDIPSADFMVVTFQVESTKHLALLKMNYKDSYIHMTGNTEEGTPFNDIIKQSQTLPAGSQKLSEAVIINLEDYSVHVVEKKYDINGEKKNYLSEIFLGCHAKMSQKTQMNIVARAVDQINQKYFENEPVKQMETKSIIQNEIEEKGVIEVEAITEKLYSEVPDIKEEFTEKLEKYNMSEAKIEPKNETTTKKFQKQFLKTDTGIEINIPMSEYNENEDFEVITNPDGTLSIIIRNINHITSR